MAVHTLAAVALCLSMHGTATKLCRPLGMMGEVVKSGNFHRKAVLSTCTGYGQLQVPRGVWSVELFE
jgi:hypothetical protein